MTYQEAIAYLDSFIDYEKITSYSYQDSFCLSRTERLLERLGNPHRKFSSILVAGTKGKGSVCAMLYSILKEANFKVGLYTSPHLVSFRERIRFTSGTSSGLGLDRMISEEEICEFVDKIKPHTDSLCRDPGFGTLSFFEIYTVLAYLAFAERAVRLAVLEVGMGGRLDATNVVDPLVSVITPISYDHTDKLGMSLESIAGEKAGIIKEGSLVVSSPQYEEVSNVIREVCRRKKARLYEVGNEVSLNQMGQDYQGQIFDVRGVFDGYPGLWIPLLGLHQAVNASVALAVIELLRFHNINISINSIREGFRKVEWPGRLQVVGRHPFILLDGAQNRASAQALKDAVKSLFPHRNLILVLGVCIDKDIEGIGEELCPLSYEVILTMAKNVRAARPEFVEKRVKKFCNRTVKTTTVTEALSQATSMASKDDLILITGSLYVVGEAISELNEDAIYGME